MPERASVLDLAAAFRTTLRFHRQMGVDQYPLTPALRQCLHPQRGKPEPVQPAVPKSVAAPPLERPSPRPVNKDTIAAQVHALHRDIETCRRCSLASARQGIMFGSGAVDSPLLVVGDYSGQKSGFSTATLFGEAEDAMLWNMMRAIGLAPEDVYVTNAIKCCPLPTQSPGEESFRQCGVHLAREIELVRPRVICAMGEAAARSLVGGGESIVRLRGRFHPYLVAGEGGSPLQVMVTFHPRFLLKNAEFKKAAWQDLQMIQRRLLAS